MMLLRFGRINGLRSTSFRKTQVLQFCDDKKLPESENTEKKDEKKTEEVKEESSASKLNRLLASMSTDDNITIVKKVEIPKPGGRAKSLQKAKIIQNGDDAEKKPKNIVEAAKNVAEILDAGADSHQKQKTESELLTKLLSHIDTDANASKSLERSSQEISLNDIIVGMKIDRSQSSKDDSQIKYSLPRSQYIRKALYDKNLEQSNENRFQKPRRKQLTEAVPNTGSVNLFGEEPLGIFKDPVTLKDSPDILRTWSLLEKRDLKLAITHPPRNYFEKMILWTEQGKLWKFPIDNEQGLEDEQRVDFSEHVFLDQHLEGWCPEKGPIRHFMELVCVGLSKNPYITAQEKRDHINWFKEYFEQKKELLKELIQDKEQAQNMEQKQLKKNTIQIIANQQNSLFGRVTEIKPFRAEFHTQINKQSRNLSLIKSENNLNEKDRKIVFIGHSATWLPFEQIKSNIEDSVVEGNKKIVFVGHSATWIPTSPSKQRKSSFSTSAFQQQGKESTSEIEKKNSNAENNYFKTIDEKDSSVQTDFQSNSKAVKQNSSASENLNKKINIENKQNISKLKKSAKIVKSMAIVDQKTKEIKIVNIRNETVCKKIEKSPLEVGPEKLLSAIKNFKLPEEASDDLILSVPTYNLNKYITTLDPNSVSNEIENAVSELEKTIRKKDTAFDKLQKGNINEIEPKKQNNINKGSTNSMEIPEKLVIYDKTIGKLKIVESKDNPHVLKEAKLQNKSLEELQAETISNYALRHWFDFDSKKNVLKEKPMIKNVCNSNLPTDLQKKVEEIREYANKMSRWSSTATSTFAEKTKENTSNIKKTAAQVETAKTLKSDSDGILSAQIPKLNKSAYEKELIFVGSMCYWLPKSITESTTMNRKNSEYENISYNKPLGDLNTSCVKEEVVLGDNVLSRIVIKDNRKFTKGKNLWELDPNVSLSESDSVVEKSHVKTKDVIETFGIPAKHNKENILLKEAPFQNRIKTASGTKQGNSQKQESLNKSKYTFQAAQLEKNTEKYSNITNKSVKALNEEEIKKTFEPVRVIMKPITIPKSDTSEKEIKITANDSNQMKKESEIKNNLTTLHQIKQTSCESKDNKDKKTEKQIEPDLKKVVDSEVVSNKSKIKPVSTSTDKISDAKMMGDLKTKQILEKSKVDKEIEDLKNFKETLLNKPFEKQKFNTAELKIVTDQIHLTERVSKPHSSTSKVENETKAAVSDTVSDMKMGQLTKQNEKIVNKLPAEDRKSSLLGNKLSEKSQKPVLVTQEIYHKQSVITNISQKENLIPKVNKCDENLKNGAKNLVAKNLNMPIKNPKEAMQNEPAKKPLSVDPSTKSSANSTTSHENVKTKELLKNAIQNTTEPASSNQSKNFVNNSFIIVEDNIETVENVKIKKPIEGSTKAKTCKENNALETSNSQDKTETIILGPPKSCNSSRSNSTQFVLVNNTNQTYSAAEPLVERKSTITAAKTESTQNKSKTAQLKLSTEVLKPKESEKPLENPVSLSSEVKEASSKPEHKSNSATITAANVESTQNESKTAQLKLSTEVLKPKESEKPLETLASLSSEVKEALGKPEHKSNTATTPAAKVESTQNKSKTAQLKLSTEVLKPKESENHLENPASLSSKVKEALGKSERKPNSATIPAVNVESTQNKSKTAQFKLSTDVLKPKESENHLENPASLSPEVKKALGKPERKPNSATIPAANVESTQNKSKTAQLKLSTEVLKPKESENHLENPASLSPEVKKALGKPERKPNSATIPAANVESTQNKSKTAQLKLSTEVLKPKESETPLENPVSLSSEVKEASSKPEHKSNSATIPAANVESTQNKSKTAQFKLRTELFKPKKSEKLLENPVSLSSEFKEALRKTEVKSDTATVTNEAIMKSSSTQEYETKQPERQLSQSKQEPDIKPTKMKKPLSNSVAGSIETQSVKISDSNVVEPETSISKHNTRKEDSRISLSASEHKTEANSDCSHFETKRSTSHKAQNDNVKSIEPTTKDKRVVKHENLQTKINVAQFQTNAESSISSPIPLEGKLDTKAKEHKSKSMLITEPQNMKGKVENSREIYGKETKSCKEGNKIETIEESLPANKTDQFNFEKKSAVKLENLQKIDDVNVKSLSSLSEVSSTVKGNLLEQKTVRMQKSKSSTTATIPSSSQSKPNEFVTDKIVSLASSAIVNKNLEEIARKNGILKTETIVGKLKPINYYIFSYPENQKTPEVQLEQPKLIVDKTLPNLFGINATKPIIKNSTDVIGNTKSNITATENQVLNNEVKKEPDLVKTFSPLEKMYKKVDKKLSQIQQNLASNDLKLPTSIKNTSVADPNSLKEFREKFKSAENRNEKPSLKENANETEKDLNPQTDDKNIIRKTYIPFSYHLSSPKDQLKSEPTQSQLGEKANESPFINLSFLKGYIKEKPKDKKIETEKSESIFKQVTNMIKEELFTYQEIPKESGNKAIKLSEESCASQPVVDNKTPIKPGVIYEQVKNMLKEDLTAKNKSDSRFVIPKSVTPAAVEKMQSILDDNTKGKIKEKAETPLKTQKFENSLNNVELPQKDFIDMQSKAVESQKSERSSVAYAETSVVPESIIKIESPLEFKQKSGTSEIDINLKKENKTAVNNEKTLLETESSTKFELNPNKDGNQLISNVKSQETHVSNELNDMSNKNFTPDKTEIKSKRNSREVANNAKSLDGVAEKSLNEEQELYKILGIANDSITKSDKVSNTAHKPSESVMDKIRNYLSKEERKPILSNKRELSTSKLEDKNIKTEAVTELIKPIESKATGAEDANLSKHSTILTTSADTKDGLANTVTEPKTEIQNVIESDKISATDKLKKILRSDSNNNSPYHMIKPLSLLEHLTNVDTEQVKIDHAIKLLTDSRSNSVPNVETNKTNTSKSQLPLLQAIEKNEDLISPNPELLAKVSISPKEKSSKLNEKIVSAKFPKSVSNSQKPNVVNKNELSNTLEAADSKLNPKKTNNENNEEEEEEGEEVEEVIKPLKHESKNNEKIKQHTNFTNKTDQTILGKSPKETRNQKLSDTKNEQDSSQNPFSKNSVKPLDKSRREPVNIIESPGPNILDIENNNDKAGTSKQEKKNITESTFPIDNVEASAIPNAKNQTTNHISDSPNVRNSEVLASSKDMLTDQSKFQIEKNENPLNVKQIDFAHNQKFIKPSRPLMKELRSVAKSNRNISSSVLDDFKIEMDRYNSLEATPEDKNKIVLKIKYLTKIEPTTSESSSSKTVDSVKKLDDDKKE